MNSNARRKPDTGLTLIEMLVTVGMLGLVSTVVAAAVAAVYRGEDSVSHVIGESHDVQQAVNYFHLDIESGPAEIADYRLTPGLRGTGCSDAGDANVLQFDTDSDDESLQPDRRIAYRLTETGTAADLDRFECVWNDALSDWDEVSVRNIADRLDASGGPAVTVRVDSPPGLDDRIVMEFAQTVVDREVSAAPRAETGLTPFGIGDCADNPLDAALGFGTFVEGDIDLDNLADPGVPIFMEGAVAVGGDIGWRGDPIDLGEANNTNGFPSVTLYASGHPLPAEADGADWAYGSPTNSLLVASDSSSDNIVLGKGTYNVVPDPPPMPGVTRVYDDMLTTGAAIEMDKNAAVFLPSDPAVPVLDFEVQFETLKACAGALSSLPDGADAEYAAPQDPSGGTYPGCGNPGGTELWLDFGGARTQVLNIPEDCLDLVDTLKLTGGSSLDTTSPLIVNIAEAPGDTAPGDDDIDFDVATPDWQTFGDYKRVLYHFTNLEGTVTIQQDVYGTIFAPFAQVVTKGDVHGAVIAQNWTHEGGGVENGILKMFNASIDWD